jgi:DNA-directed RNA polymerase beta subunit
LHYHKSWNKLFFIFFSRIEHHDKTKKQQKELEDKEKREDEINENPELIDKQKALDAKKDAKSYVAQLQVLIEIRDRSANIILKRERISIVNLPLMTQAATFIINGCERVVVSQIIRSPGIYFEKNKRTTEI